MGSLRPKSSGGLLGGVRNLLPQLEALDLSGGGLDSQRMQYLMPLLPKLRHLKELDLRGNYLRPDDAQRIQADVPGALVTDQRALPTVQAPPRAESDGAEHRAFLRIHGIRSAEDVDD